MSRRTKTGGVDPGVPTQTCRARARHIIPMSPSNNGVDCKKLRSSSPVLVASQAKPRRVSQPEIMARTGSGGPDLDLESSFMT